MTTTKTTLIPRGLITDALDAAGIDTDICEDTEDSFGIMFDDVSELVLFSSYLGQEASNWDSPIAVSVDQLLSQTETEHAGRGIVAYWPGYTLTEE